MGISKILAVNNVTTGGLNGPSRADVTPFKIQSDSNPLLSYFSDFSVKRHLGIQAHPLNFCIEEHGVLILQLLRRFFLFSFPLVLG